MPSYASKLTHLLKLFALLALYTYEYHFHNIYSSHCNFELFSLKVFRSINEQVEKFSKTVQWPWLGLFYCAKRRFLMIFREDSIYVNISEISSKLPLGHDSSANIVDIFRYFCFGVYSMKFSFEKCFKMDWSESCEAMILSCVSNGKETKCKLSL